MNQQTNRLTVSEIKNEALKFFNLEKGIPFTFLSFLKRPYQTIYTYLHKNRSFISNPLQYLFFSVALYTLATQFHQGIQAFFAENKIAGRDAFKALEQKLGVPIVSSMEQAQEIYLSSINFLYILAIPIVALCTYWFFKPKYNYDENLAIHCYMYGTANWLSLTITTLTISFKLPSYYIYVLVFSTYLVITYLIKHIYKQSWLKSFITQLFLLIVFMIIGQIYLYSFFVYYLLIS